MNWLEKSFLRLTGRGHVVAAYEAQHERMMKVRRLAAQLWLSDGGHMPYRNGGMIFEFMVSYPPTRMKYERIAEQRLYGEVANDAH